MLDRIRVAIDKQIEIIKDSVCSGDVKSFDEYKHLSGQIRGLKIARREMELLFTSMDDDD